MSWMIPFNFVFIPSLRKRIQLAFQRVENIRRIFKGFKWLELLCFKIIKIHVGCVIFTEVKANKDFLILNKGSHLFVFRTR